MISECVDIFMQAYEKDKSLILQNYSLAQGNYYFVDYNTGRVLDSLLVTDDTEVTALYRQFKVRDQMSILLDMNKPIDSKKQIHSNNYLSFYVKKVNVSGVTAEYEKVKSAAEGYYDTFLDYSKKYDKNKMQLLEGLEIEDEPERESEILKIKEWVHNNIEEFKNFEDFKEDKNYLKIFFLPYDEVPLEDSKEDQDDIKKYELESTKYVIPFIYNTNSHNVEIDGKIAGVPNNNFNLNAKKPFLLNRTKPNGIPHRVPMDEIQRNKLFFDWLFALSGSRRTNVYIGKAGTQEEEICIKTFERSEAIGEVNFKGYFLRIIKGKKEAEILDFDLVPKMYDEEGEVYLKNHLDRKFGDVEPGYYSTKGKNRKDALDTIDKALFGNRLRNSFFGEPKDISKDDPVLKNCILNTRKLFSDWYFKGYELTDNYILRDTMYRLVLRHLEKNQYVSFVHAYNVMKSLQNYTQKAEGENMGKERREITLKKELSARIEKDSEMVEDLSEEEFCFALGQLWYYLNSLSEAQDKNFSFVTAVLQTKKLPRVKDLTLQLIQKYDHAMSMNNIRLNNLVAMIMAYEGSGVLVEQNWIMAGFAAENVLYEKKNNNINNKESN